MHMTIYRIIRVHRDRDVFAMGGIVAISPPSVFITHDIDDICLHKYIFKYIAGKGGGASQNCTCPGR